MLGALLIGANLLAVSQPIFDERVAADQTAVGLLLAGTIAVILGFRWR